MPQNLSDAKLSLSLGEQMQPLEIMENTALSPGLWKYVREWQLVCRSG